MLSPIERVPMPARFKKLPRDHRGYPVPFFVMWHEGKPVFPAFDPAKFATCHKRKLCWLCGEPLGRFMVYVIGPMCAVNRVTTEMACHLECAEYGARVCPFLINPAMRRVPTERYSDAPVRELGGIAHDRNPGAMILWSCRDYRLVSDGGGGYLVSIGEPVRTAWWARGREATPQEALDAFQAGVHVLGRMAAKHDGEEGLAHMAKLVQRAIKLLPRPELAHNLTLLPEPV